MTKIAQKMTDAELQPTFEAFLAKLDFILEADGQFVSQKDYFKIIRDRNNLPGVEANGRYAEDLTLGFLIFMDSVGIGLIDEENPAGLAAMKTGTLH